MKGKIAFVLGAAVGYVLGTRAGRERYEQIKLGAQNVWNTEPVQRGVNVVRSAAQGRVDELKATVVRAGKGAFAAMAREQNTAVQTTGVSTKLAAAGDATDSSAASNPDAPPAAGGAA